MSEPRISDIPSIQKNIEEIRKLRSVKDAMPILRPILKLLGGDIEKIDETFSKFEEIERLVSDIATIPDRFNEIFAQRGGSI